MATSIQKVEACRRNARKSTGPRTAEGKAIVAANAVVHGLLTAAPIVSAFEDEDAWQSHLQATLASLHPQDRVEVLLAERVALLSWRLKRVAAYEVAVIDAQLAGAEVAWARSRNPDKSEAVLMLPKLRKEIAALKKRLEVLAALADGPATADLDTDTTCELLDDVAEEVEIDWDAESVEIPGYAADSHFSSVDWSVSLARNVLEQMGKKKEWTVEDIVIGYTSTARENLSKKRRMLKKLKRELRHFRNQQILPDERSLAKIRRYETTLERSMLRCLRELELCRGSRHGEAASDVGLIGKTASPGEGA